MADHYAAVTQILEDHARWRDLVSRLGDPDEAGEPTPAAIAEQARRGRRIGPRLAAVRATASELAGLLAELAADEPAEFSDLSREAQADRLGETVRTLQPDVDDDPLTGGPGRIDLLEDGRRAAGGNPQGAGGSGTAQPAGAARRGRGPRAQTVQARALGRARVLEGLHPNAIAAELGAHVSTVYYQIAALRRDGELPAVEAGELRRRGGPGKEAPFRSDGNGNPQRAGGSDHAA